MHLCNRPSVGPLQGHIGAALRQHNETHFMWHSSLIAEDVRQWVHHNYLHKACVS